MAEFAASFRAVMSEQDETMSTEFRESREEFGTGFGDVVTYDAPGTVHYDVEQDLTTEEQARARQNIGAASGAEVAEHVANANIHVTSADKTSWNNKYTKPASGIPQNDLTLDVQQTLDEAVQDHVTLSEHVQNTTIHVTSSDKSEWSAKYDKPSGGIPESDLNSTLQGKIDGAATSADLTAHTSDTSIHVTAADKTSWNSKYTLPSGGIPESDLSASVQQDLGEGVQALSEVQSHESNTAIHVSESDRTSWDSKYSKPPTGIPTNDLDASIQQTLDEAVQDHSTLSSHVRNSTIHVTAQDKTDWNAKYDKPSGGIPATDLASAVQTTLTDADSHIANTTIHVTSADKTAWGNKYDKPSGGIPSSDMATAVQTTLTNADSHIADGDIHVTSAQKTAWSAKYDLPSGGIPATDLAQTYAGAATAGGTANKTAAIPYAQVDSTSTSTAFTATVDGITELKDGVCVLLKNGVVTSAANFTININGLGAKGAYNNMAAATRESTTFNINYTVLFIYDSTRVSGGCWIYYRGYFSDANSIGYQLRTNSSSLPAADAFVRYRILFTSADGTKFVPATTSTSTNATASRTVNQRPIDPFGEIVYYGTTAAVAVNASPGATALWQQYVFSLGYSFNRTGAALVLPFPASIYIKCAPQADGSAIIDADTPYVTALPTTEDGKIYIFLGRVYSATNIEMLMNHPVYCYKGGKIQFWTNTSVPTKTSDLQNDSGYLTLATLPIWNGGVT